MPFGAQLLKGGLDRIEFTEHSFVSVLELRQVLCVLAKRFLGDLIPIHDAFGFAKRVKLVKDRFVAFLGALLGTAH